MTPRRPSSGRRTPRPARRAREDRRIRRGREALGRPGRKSGMRVARRRVVSLMWRDDLDTAFRHLDLYDRFGCPGDTSRSPSAASCARATSTPRHRTRRRTDPYLLDQSQRRSRNLRRRRRLPPLPPRPSRHTEKPPRASARVTRPRAVFAPARFAPPGITGCTAPTVAAGMQSRRRRSAGRSLYGCSSLRKNACRRRFTSRNYFSVELLIVLNSP